MNVVRQTKEQEDDVLRRIAYSREQLQDDIRTLRTWLNEQPHLPPSRLKESDHFLKNFLVGCKGSLERSKEKLDKYYSFRSSDSPTFDKLDPLGDDTKNMSERLLTGILPKCLEDGTIVLFNDFTEKFKNAYWEIMKINVMLCELMVRREDILPQQVIAVNNFANSKFDVSKCPLRLLKDCSYILEAYPFRVKSIVYLNIQPHYMHFINFILKPLFTKKIGERIRFYPGGWECLTDIIPKEILPKEAFNEGPSIQDISDELYKVLAEKRHWFLNEISEGTDEGKRPPNSFNSIHPFFGVEGSFKTLRID